MDNAHLAWFLNRFLIMKAVVAALALLVWASSVIVKIPLTFVCSSSVQCHRYLGMKLQLSYTELPHNDNMPQHCILSVTKGPLIVATFSVN